MANPQNIQSILDALKAVQPNQSSSLPAPTHSGSYPLPPASYPTPPAAGAYAPPAHYPTQPPAYPYPAPAASGNVDLSAIRPTASGTVSIEQAIAQAKSYAAEQGVTPYDRQTAYAPNDGGGRSYRRSRSRSPNARFRDNYQGGYRDERRDQSGQNRGYQRDRSFSPGPRKSDFSPRAGGGHGRERSPLRGGGDDNSEIMEIESNLVGLIIGRQGENLRRVEGESRARVQFLPATDSTQPFRLCKISGAPPRRAEARAMITKIIQDSGLSSGGPGGRGGRSGGGRITDAPAPEPQEGEATLKIMVPDRTVGLIIGRGGETIRDLQERSRCHINIVSESKSVNGLRPVNLIGSPEAAKMAKDLILEIVDSDSRNGNNPGQGNTESQQGRMGARGGAGGHGGGGGGDDKINDSMYVPSEAVGMIIGKGGETIREMQNMTGCKINVSQTGDIEREIGLVGSHDAISRAKQAIQEKVDAVKQKGSGGGGGGGRGGRYRDYDDSGYGQNANQYSAPQGAPQAGNNTAGGSAQDDPYAAYGGYAAWASMWMQALSAQQGQGQGGNPPPGA